MSRELEALKRIDFIAGASPRIRSKVNEYGEDFHTVKSALEQLESIKTTLEIKDEVIKNISEYINCLSKYKKAWSIFNTNHITYEHKEIIKKANSYNEYVDLYHYSFRITDFNEYLLEEDQFILLREMLRTM